MIYDILHGMKKIAVITGASSGMGKDFALQFSDFFEADELWLIARRKENLIKVANEIEKKKADFPEKNIPHARAIEADISGRAGLARFNAFLNSEKLLEEKNGGITVSVLINNAGFGTYGTFEETNISKELDMIDLNCISLTGICGSCIPLMKKNSVIINTASLASFLPLGNFAVYAATKSYVLSFTMALAAELSDKGIKVCALCPGPVSTEFAKVASNGARTEVRHGLPSEKVVRHCLKKASRNKHVAIYAFQWKFKAAASRFIGRYLGALFTYKYCKRPNGSNGLS